jgi:hypothetical protein
VRGGRGGDAAQHGVTVLPPRVRGGGSGLLRGGVKRAVSRFSGPRGERLQLQASSRVILALYVGSGG